MIKTIENDFLKISAKASGAELISIKNKINGIEYLWQGDPKFWGRRSPVLFPIVGKLNNTTFRSEGKEFQLPQHGFARDHYFELVNSEPSSLIYSLKSNEETLKCYPYKFELTITYKLLKNKIEVKYEVLNADDKRIWFSIGGHPAFNCPLEPKEKFSNYFLEFDQQEHADIHLITEGLLNGRKQSLLKNNNKIELSEQLFSQDALIFKGLKSSSVILKSNSSSASISFSFKGFPNLGIWSKPGPFVCIEPWHGHADPVDFVGDLKDKPGILSLEKGAAFTCTYGIEIN